MADTGVSDLAAGAGSEFITEIKDDLEQLEPDLLAMEEQTSGVDKELINHAFRAIHSIKGGAGFCGLKDLGLLSHAMENVLMRIRDGRLAITPNIADALLSGLDKLKLMVSSLDSEEEVLYQEEIDLFEQLLSSEQTVDSPETDNSGAVFSSANDENAGLSGKTACGAVSSDQSPGRTRPAEPGDMITLETPEASVFNSKRFQVSREKIETALNENQFIYAVWFDPVRDFMEKQRKPADLYKDIENTGEVLFFDLDPGRELPDLAEGAEGFYLVVATILDGAFIAEVLEVPGDEIYLFDSKLLSFLVSGDRSHVDMPKPQGGESPSPLPETLDQAGGRSESAGPEAADEPAVPEPVVSDSAGEPAGPAYAEKKSEKTALDKRKASETIRVNVDLITRLMNFAGELVLSRNQLRPLIDEYARENADLNSVMQDLDMVTSEIQEDIMQIRMQPVGHLFSRFKRIIRDTARQLAKKVSYTMEGEEVELDRTVLEGLASPMTHLMRNCVDHGIEAPDQRRSAGKPETGTIAVKAFHQGGHVHIIVSDDGKGIDPEKISAAAVEKKVITEETAGKMTSREKIDLIFSPGFSTSDEITDVSGRGVGMDVVKTNIEKLRGYIDIDSFPGRGTIVQVILPLTLAIVSALIVGIDRFRFAIPQVNVSEVIFLKSSDLKKKLEKLGGSDVIRLRERLLPVIRLRNLLDIDTFYIDETTGEKKIERRRTLADRRKGTSESSPDMEQRSSRQDRRQDEEEELYIVVIKVGVNQFGLCVETLFDNEEIVVKPLSEHIKSCRCFSGATILGDGGVIMILDASGMANEADLRFAVVNAEEQRRKSREAERRQALSEGRNVIVFANAENEFFAIPLEKMVRLEKIEPRAVHTIGSRKFIEFRKTTIPIFHLEEFVAANPCAGKLEELYVIIPKGLSVKSGIIVSDVIDTMEVFQELQREANSPDAVEGTAFVDNRLVQFLDMEKITGLMEAKM
ncbi:MAG: chemotaxis protein CheA [Desulfobacteraceae bacterium]